MLVAEIVGRQLGETIVRHLGSIHITDHLDAVTFLLEPVKNTEYAFVRSLISDFAEYPDSFGLLKRGQIGMSDTFAARQIFVQKEVFNLGNHTVFVPDFFKRANIQKKCGCDILPCETDFRV